MRFKWLPKNALTMVLLSAVVLALVVVPLACCAKEQPAPSPQPTATPPAHTEAPTATPQVPTSTPKEMPTETPPPATVAPTLTPPPPTIAPTTTPPPFVCIDFEGPALLAEFHVGDTFPESGTPIT